jgi:NAD(P)-dependent dehydrogenase (short-subunit alcohol dehydrogenase family)
VPNSPRVVLITGCSSGIGAATAAAFRGAGWTTVATARKIATLESLREQGCEIETLDVTSDEDRGRVVAAVLARHGRIDVLVNNAGYAEYGPLEEVSIDRWRDQFETNVFGLVAMMQLVAPSMRAQGRGRIINVSSMGGIITLPLGSAYHASKWSIEALSDVSRVELRPFGVDVIVVEPGVVLNEFATPAVAGLQLDPSSPYAAVATKFTALLLKSYAKKSLTNLHPAAIASVIVRSASARRPRTRYVAAAAARVLIVTKRLLPDRWYDAVVRSQVH